MGNFYTSFTLKETNQQAVAAVMGGRPAFVTVEKNGCVVVYDKETEEQNFEIILELGARLSREVNCVVLATLNHDDDIFEYALFQRGELIDEYNSCPDYFSTTVEEPSPPQGGDAKKLCAAFGTKNISRVQKMLNQITMEGDYSFETERHEDLAQALGVPQFSVAGYQHFSDFGWPSGLEKGEFLATDNLPPKEPTPIAPVSGYYKVSFRAHPKLTKSIPSVWMPGSWDESECSDSDLSKSFHKTTDSYLKSFKALRYEVIGYKKLKRILNPDSRESGGINLLHGNRRYFGQIVYNRHYIKSQQTEKEQIIIAFTALFENEAFSCTNKLESAVDSPVNHKIIRITSNDVETIHKNFLEHIENQSEKPGEFSDLQSLKDWFNSNQIKTFEEKVRRGIMVRMSDYEVEIAQSERQKTIDATK